MIEAGPLHDLGIMYFGHSPHEFKKTRSKSMRTSSPHAQRMQLLPGTAECDHHALSTTTIPPSHHSLGPHP